jgi:hypothetical protein
MQITENSENNEPAYVVLPLEVQVAFSTFLYTKWQENVTRRLDKYLTFPQWLTTLKANPHQLEECDLADEVPHYQNMHFVGFEWLSRKEWGFGAALTTGNEYTAFDLYLGMFTLIWMCNNDE